MQNEGYTPVKMGDVFSVKIDAVGDKGDGICRKEGFVLVVPGTKKGDKVKIRVTKVLKSVGFAEVIGKAEDEVKKEDVDAIMNMESEKKDNLPPPEDPIYTEDF